MNGAIIDQRTQVDTVGKTVTEIECRRRSNQFFNECVCNRRLHQNPIGTDTGLTTVTVFRNKRALNRRVEIRILKDNERRVPA